MVFISYSSKEYDIANQIRNILQERGVACWMAPESIPAGGDYSNEIPNAIKNCDTFLVVLSQHSLSSVWVPKEMDFAITLRKQIIPLHIDDSEITTSFQFRLSDVQRVDSFQGITAASKAIADKINGKHSSPNAADISSSLPSIVTYYELLGAASSSEINIQKLRSEADVTASLSVPIGKNDQGGDVKLNLHHKGDGSSGIIIGPSGSGKSEFIQTLFLSLALFFPSDEVRLHIIDLKDGKTAHGMVALPHMGECLTELSDSSVYHFVQTIKEEVQSRKELLNKFGVSNIYQYLKKRISDENDMPAMPHIFIAIDEFRELKVHFPDVAAEIKQFGRECVGIHLIYSTAYPHGLIDDSIVKMCDFRICSSMQQNIEETIIVQGERRIPGRLYLQSQAQDAVQLVQLAQSGAVMDSYLVDKKELRDYQWFFRIKSQREALVNAIMRYELD